MIALTSPYLWYTTRATGFVALILFTIVVTLGTFVANRDRRHHRRTLRAQRAAPIGLDGRRRLPRHPHHHARSSTATCQRAGVSTLVPMTSAYKRVPVALGAVAFDLILAVWISSLLKVRIANRTWRFIHWFSWLAFASALVHTLLAGTDSRKGFGLIVAVICARFVLAAAMWRYLGRPTRAAGRTALSPLAAAKDQSVPARALLDSPPVVLRPTAPRPQPTVPPRPSNGGFQRGPRAPSKKRKSR